MAPAHPTVASLAGDAKRSYVRGMFTAIAPRYDLLNHVLSLNIDRLWRRRAVARLQWRDEPDGTYLDLCAGTLDLAAQLGRQRGFGGRVVGADFALPMLQLGRTKSARLRPVGADALALPFPEASFSGCTIGFGVRNLTDLEHGLAEAARVVRPGGWLVILEFSTPRNRVVRALYLWYFRHVLPFIGRVVSKHTTAYDYLPQSVLEFPSPERLAAMISAAGFRNVRFELLSLGIAALHWGRRA